MIQNVATIESPKKVRSSMDWLANVKESGQDVARYMGGDPNISWINPRCKKIILFVIDNQITDDILMKLQSLVTAYFYGMNVELAKAGKKLTHGTGRNKQTKTVPENFLETHAISSRSNPFRTKSNELYQGD